MIREIPLEESKHYSIYKYATRPYKRGIKVDTCLLLDNIETYYNKEDKIVYIESFDFFHINDKIEGNGEITRKMLRELTKYLGWKNWSIKLYYYDYEEAVITIRLKKDKKLKNKKNLAMNSLIDDLKQIIPEKPSIGAYGNNISLRRI